MSKTNNQMQLRFINNITACEYFYGILINCFWLYILFEPHSMNTGVLCLLILFCGTLTGFDFNNNDTFSISLNWVSDSDLL